MSKTAGRFFIGVDGGASKTLVRVLDSAGRVLGEGRAGPASIRLSVPASWAAIREALAEALAGSGVSLDDSRHRFHCGMGLAGTELATAREAFLATPHPFARLLLKSDGYTACLGAHAGADGALIAVGTGVVAYQIQRGRESQVSGWGFPHDDQGGGAWLGLRAVGLTLRWRDGREPASPLFETLLGRFDDDLSALVTWACEADATEFATLAPLVVEQARIGTPQALELLREAVGEIDRVGEALLTRAGGEVLPCCLLGGMAPFLEPWLGEGLKRRLVAPRGSGLDGALRMIRDSGVETGEARA